MKHTGSLTYFNPFVITKMYLLTYILLSLIGEDSFKGASESTKRDCSWCKYFLNWMFFCICFCFKLGLCWCDLSFTIPAKHVWQSNGSLNWESNIGLEIPLVVSQCGLASTYMILLPWIYLESYFKSMPWCKLSEFPIKYSLNRRRIIYMEQIVW